MSRYFGEARTILRLALPIALAQIGNITVQIADSAMVGAFGGEDPLPLAAVAFGTSISCLPFFFCLGLAMGLTPVVGELFAQGRKQEMAHYLQSSLGLYMLFGVVFMALQLACEPLLYMLGQPKEVVDMALPYYRLVAFNLPPLMLYGSFGRFLEGVGNTKATMAVTLISNVINIALNYIFIFGYGEIEAMGVYGAGLATLIARGLTPLMLVAYFVRRRDYREYLHLFTARFERWKMSLQLLKMGLPISGQMVMEAGAFVVTGVMMGWFGAEAISAGQIGNTYGNSTFMLVVSLGSATTICVSHAFGRRDITEISNIVRTSLSMATMWGLFVVLSFFSLRHIMPLLFTENEDVVLLASQMLVLYGAYQVSDSLQCTMVGILRGLQQVRSIAAVSFVAYFLLNIPVGYMMAFYFDLGAKGLVVGYFVGLTTAAILYGWQLHRTLTYYRKIS